jgi:hypothetical protein
MPPMSSRMSIYNFSCAGVMEGAKEVKCSNFGDAIGVHM